MNAIKQIIKKIIDCEDQIFYLEVSKQYANLLRQELERLENMETKVKYSKLNSMEKDYVQSVYKEEHITDDIETFYEDNFVICESCHEITYRDELTDNDFINAGGEMVICQYCAEDGCGQ